MEKYCIGTAYYLNAYNTWTHRDIIKRQTAIKNNLKYIAVWTYDDFLKLKENNFK